MLKNDVIKSLIFLRPPERHQATCKNIFTCLFSVHNTISLSRHEQVCLIRLLFERFFSHHRARYLSKRSLIKDTCSWHDKLIVLHQATLDELIQRFPKVITDINALESEFLEYQATPDDELPAYFDEDDKFMGIDHICHQIAKQNDLYFVQTRFCSISFFDTLQ